jgi:gliding motility-associated-like protein
MKKILVILILAFLIVKNVNAQIPSYVPTNGLVAWYPFTGNANDSSGNSNDGTDHGASLTYDRFCNPNSAYSFNAQGDYIIGSCTNYPPADRTISLWFYSTVIDQPGAGFGVMGYGGGGFAITWFECINSPIDPHAYEMQCHWNVNDVHSNYNPVPNNQWHLWVVTEDPSGTRFYIDGMLVTSSPIYVNNTFVNGKVFAFGEIVAPSGASAYTDANVGQYYGVLDDIGIWNRALTPVEVLGLYVISNPVTPTITSNGPTTFCQGNSVTLTTVNYSSYLWSNGQTTQSITVNSGGTYSVTVNNSACSTASLTVTVNTNPTVTITGNNSICQGNLTTLDAGTFSQYIWSNAATTQTITVNAANTYIVTVTDGNGCTGTSSLAVTVNAAPISTLPSNSSFCLNDSTLLDAGLFSNYNWSTGSTIQTIYALIPGLYTVTITDGIGCTGTASCNVTQLIGITSSITSQTNVLCNGGSNGTATITANGSSSYTYSWNTNPVQTTTIASNLAAGIYFVTVTGANGCSSVTTDTITEPPALTVSLLSHTNALCNGGNNGDATIVAGGGTSGYTYNWNSNPVQTNSTASNLIAGTYIVTVTDANNCTITTTVTITQPLIALNATISAFTNASSCGVNDGSATVSSIGGTGMISFSWNSIPVQTTAQATNLGAGIYTVTITDANGCTATTSVTLIQPGMLSVNTSANMIVCQGTNITISVIAIGGTIPYSYNWNPGGLGGSSQTVTPGITTNYSVTVTDASGCSITPPPIIITVKDTPTVSFSSNVIKGCSPLEVNFTDNSNIGGGDSIMSRTWNFGNGFGSFYKNPNTIYYIPGAYSINLLVTSSNGCSQTYSALDMINAFQTPNADFIANPYHTNILSPEIDFTNQSLNADSWRWNFGDNLSGNFSNKKNPIYSYSTPGIYNVILIATNVNNCSDTIQKNIIIDDDVEFYIPSAFTPNGDGLNDNFTAFGYNILQYHLDIFNRWGELVFSTNDISNGWNGQFNNSLANQDVYLYRINILDGFNVSHEYTGKVTLIR